MSKENKTKKEKIIEWLEIKIAIIYFYTRRFFEHGIVRWFYEQIKRLYNLILSVLLLVFTISFIFFYIKHFLDISFTNIFINFQKFLDNNLLIYLYLIILIGLIGIKYILEIIKFVFKYFINWTIFWILFIFSGIIATSIEKSFFDNINYLKYLGIFYLILILGGFLKFIFLLDKEDSKKGYYFNLYKKTYKYIKKSDKLKCILKENKLKEKNLSNKYLKSKNNLEKNKVKVKRIIESLKKGNKIIPKDIFSKILEVYNIKKKNIKNYTSLNLIKILEPQIEIKNNELKELSKKSKDLLKDINKNLNIQELKLFIKKIKYFSIKRNFIEPISDEPIGLGNDIFGNEIFAKNIYDILNGINFKEFKKSYSIGIVGEWGGGKSSIINLLDEQYLDGNPNFKVLKFNPWDYKKENLVNNFFGELSKILGVKDISNLMKKYY